MNNIYRTLLLSAALLVPQSISLTAQDKTPPARSGSVRFAAIGDMGTGGKEQYDVAQQMVQESQKAPLEFVIMLGDNIYGGKSPAELAKKFDLPYKQLLDAGVQFYASLGKHDDTNERFYKPFNMNGQRYYTFKKGAVRFYALDSTYMDPVQLAWLEKELASAGTDWKICYFHHPLYSSAAFHGSSTELRALLEPMFVKYGVNVVFAGHEHVYERTKPQKGIYYFTEGASGELRAGNLRQSDFKAFGFDRDQSFLVLEVSGDELAFRAISRTGVTVDSGTIHRSAASAPR
ncbi:MAG TPA: metallophosphoesterase [Bryobacteraceae bacterium]|nr:metallophosphoesterase [Bryobacteraceae bacterium]